MATPETSEGAEDINVELDCERIRMSRDVHILYVTTPCECFDPHYLVMKTPIYPYSELVRIIRRRSVSRKCKPYRVCEKTKLVRTLVVAAACLTVNAADWSSIITAAMLNT
jgi:hypothetical protein